MPEAIGSSVRVAAVGDVHCTRGAQTSLREFFAHMGQAADAILLCGDLTDYGLPEEAHQLVQELSDCLHVPVVAVLGNHDYESGKQADVKAILCEAGVTVLDGDSCEVHGIGFVGVKGFAGGFSDYCLEPWGEDAIKAFVQEGVSEALKLEAALARIHARQRIVALHYAPIEDTVRGEPPQVHAFLGSRRLEEPLNRYGVTAVFHGHAHNGTPEGRTLSGIPVYNVAKPLLERHFPDKPGYRVLEIAVNAPDVQPALTSSP